MPFRFIRLSAQESGSPALDSLSAGFSDRTSSDRPAVFRGERTRPVGTQLLVGAFEHNVSAQLSGADGVHNRSANASRPDHVRRHDGYCLAFAQFLKNSHKPAGIIAAV